MSENLNLIPLMQLQEVSLAAPLGSGYLLADISLDIFVGKRLAIVGSSGAGKTSVLRLLNRLSEFTSGSIVFDNQDLRKVRAEKLRQEVVLVPQEPKLLGMRIKEAITYPLVLQKLPRAEINSRLEYWLGVLNIPEDWLDRHELQLSLGQRQLVAMARALVMQPKILLLDEPTSALDIGRAHHLLNVLSELASGAAMAVVIVNHQLELVEQFSDRVLYLRQGRQMWNHLTRDVDWQQLREQILQEEKSAAQMWE